MTLITPALKMAMERFGRLTPTQEKAYTAIASGNNALIIAPTGAGKTEAAMLAVFDGLKKAQEEGREETCVYVTPLRALNRDINERLKWWCEKLGLELAVRHGDTSSAEKHKHGKRHIHVMITTPETFQGITLGKNISKLVPKIRYVVVDEVHELVDSKRGFQLSLFLERLGMRNQNFQRIALSASLALPEEAAAMVFGNRECELIDAREGKKHNVDVLVARNSPKKVIQLARGKKTLVFINTRRGAEELTYKLKSLGLDCEVHHGSLAQQIRTEAESRFKNGLLRCLVATSSLELGLDIGDVDLVIQVGSPRAVGRLLQRLGRAGHGLERVSNGHIIVPGLEEYFEASAIVKQLTHKKLEPKCAIRNALDITAHQIIGALLEYGTLEAHYLYDVFRRSACFTMEFGMFEAIVKQLAEEHICWYEQGCIRYRRRGRVYFVSNISSIPKETKVHLVNIRTDREIVSVDELFLARIERGMVILSRGEAWVVVRFEEDKVLVEKTSSALLVIPDWVGEEIPVSWETAQIAKGYWKNKDNRFALDEIQLETFAVEGRKIIMLHTCFGDRINTTIARIVSELMTSTVGKRIGHAADSYRILFDTPADFDEAVVETALRSIKKPREILIASIGNSPLFARSFSHVAVMFGLFTRWRRVHPKIIKTFKDTPVYLETMASVLRQYFDAACAVQTLEKLATGEIGITRLQNPPSVFGRAGLQQNMFVPEKTEVPKQELAGILMKETMELMAKLGCMHCGTPFYKKLSTLEQLPKCPSCGAKYIYYAGLLRRAQIINKYGKQTADLVSAYGWDAVVVLSVLGIGPRKARQILAKKHRDMDGLFITIYDAQQEFFRNRRFWSVD